MRSNDSSRSSLMPKPPPVSSAAKPCSASARRAPRGSRRRPPGRSREHRQQHVQRVAAAAWPRDRPCPARAERRGRCRGAARVARDTPRRPRAARRRRPARRRRAARGSSRAPRTASRRRRSSSPSTCAYSDGGATPSVRGQPRERDGLEALAVRERGRGVDDGLGARVPRAPSGLRDRAIHRASRLPRRPGRGRPPAAPARAPAALAPTRVVRPRPTSPSRRAGSAGASSTSRRRPIVVNVSPRDHRAVARVEERDVAGRVARGRDDLEAADAVARDAGGAAGLRTARPAARRLALDHGLAGEDAGVELGDQVPRPRRRARSRSASSEPTWSPWPCVSAIRRIGAPAGGGDDSRRAAPPSVVSTSVKPSSSRTRKALTKRRRVSWVRFSVTG